MRSRYGSLVILTGLAILATTPGSAQQVYHQKKVAIAGKPLKIQRAWGINEFCKYEFMPTFQVLIPPRNGKLDFIKAVDYPSFSASGPFARFVKCNGSKVKMIQAWYTPDKRYRGSEQIKLTTSYPAGLSEWPNGGTETVVIDIEVIE